MTWTGAQKMLLAGGAIAGVVVSVFAAGEKLSPLIPVTWSSFPIAFSRELETWVDDVDDGLPSIFAKLAIPYVEDRKKDVEAARAEYRLLAADTDSKFRMLADQVAIGNAAQVDTKITVLQGQLRASNKEVMELERRISLNPNDEYNLDRLIVVRQEIRVMEEDLRNAQCELFAIKKVRPPAGCQ